MQNCPRCGFDARDGDRWCRSCGQDLRDGFDDRIVDDGNNWECDGCGLEYSKRPQTCPDCLDESFTAVDGELSTIETTAPTPRVDEDDDTNWSAVVAASEENEFDRYDLLYYGGLLVVLGLSTFVYYRFV
jgi:hypothetical protein